MQENNQGKIHKQELMICTWQLALLYHQRKYFDMEKREFVDNPFFQKSPREIVMDLDLAIQLWDALFLTYAIQLGKMEVGGQDEFKIALTGKKEDILEILPPIAFRNCKLSLTKELVNG